MLVDEPIIEVSTDKVDTEIPSKFGGIVAAVFVRERDEVAVGFPMFAVRAS